ncbi:MAG: hypothetical protein IPJ27_19625 [Candidatus Accumulibacter sp.]|uniref:Uncharacterized protein n=1 Tax=Candidatus Accumulibacter proximus TaxID=2954385 RepID=A0A935Q2A6_9PROT|nr:hypothetical protein [Candidatus Accumulibacter proximus]
MARWSGGDVASFYLVRSGGFCGIAIGQAHPDVSHATLEASHLVIAPRMVDRGEVSLSEVALAAGS